ncbi:Acylphosphatase [Eubacterium plexicaudatum ASF492]|uniref:acylphosphatase n=1 Tax=Eubacterium plexicaudatum ASF492 TaxID=1235802 RepID=N2A0K2_9FIRM|nr:Acylphosphatase [Eubacterium plexicaudatum ASF492]
MEIVRKHIRFTGMVQGVGFRYKSSYVARSLGITGWVRNNADDSVEMEAQGTEEQIYRLLKMLNKDSYIRIDKIETDKLPVENAERSFRIIGY